MEFSKIENLRYEVTIKKNSDREVVMQGLFKTGRAVVEFYDKALETLGIDKDGFDENGDSYTLFTTEYDVEKKEYSSALRTTNVYALCRRYSGIRYDFDGENFGSAYITPEEDITDSLSISKKRFAMVDKITQMKWRSVTGSGCEYRTYYKNGTSDKCYHKNELNAIIDAHIKEICA